MDAIIKDLGLLINATLIATPPLLLAALGSCFTERSGTVNIGIEGMMTIGAFIGAVRRSGNRKRLAGISMCRACMCGSGRDSGHCLHFLPCRTRPRRYSYQLPWPGSCHLPLQCYVQQLHGYTGKSPSSKLPKLFDGMVPGGSFWTMC